MKNILVPLEVAIDTGYMSLEQVHVWADAVVVKFLRPKAWIIELACSSSLSEAAKLAWRGEGDPIRDRIPDDRGRLVLGFHFLRFREGILDVASLHSCIAEEVDPYIVDCWSIEDVGEFFRRIYPSEQDRLDEIEKQFGGYGNYAEEWYLYLLSDECLTDNAALFSHDRAL